MAGDELIGPPYAGRSPAELDKLIATGFLRMGPDGTADPDVDQPVARNDVVAETIKIVSTSLLGLSVGCAQCHSHRYDPITQTDYYGLAGIFVSTELLSGLWNRPGDNTSYFDVNLLHKLSYAPGKRPQHLSDPAQIQIRPERSDDPPVRERKAGG